MLFLLLFFRLFDGKLIVGLSIIFLYIKFDMASFSKQISPLRFLIALLLWIQVLSACPKNCLDCDPSGNTCFACGQTYEMSVFGTCVEPKVPQCVLYGPQDACFACTPSHRIEQGKCVKDFTGCININNNDGSCFQCGFGRTIKSGKCVNVFNCAIPAQTCPNCLPGYELKDNICRNTQPNCEKVRSDNGVCEKCKQGFSLQGFQCVEQSKILKNCYVTVTGGICTYCKRGFSFYGGQCRLPKQIETMIKGATQQTIIVQKTITSSSDTQINNPVVTSLSTPQPQSQPSLTSNTGFTSSSSSSSSSSSTSSSAPSASFEFGGFSSGSSQLNNNAGFSSIGPNQNDFNSQGQALSSTSNQKSTTLNSQNTVNSQNTGSFTSGGSISDFSSTITIPKCIQIINGKCVQCEDNFVPTKQGKCIALSKRCQSYDLSAGLCRACLPFFKLQNNKCIDKYCIQENDSEVCLKCKDGFTNPQEAGKACFKSGCLEFKDGECARCADGFIRNQDGTCDQLPAKPLLAAIQNCQVLDTNSPGKCLICVYGWYPAGNNCLKVSSLCDGHNVENGNCFACKNDLKLQSGKCIDENCQQAVPSTGLCQKCKSGFQLNVNSVCIYNDPNCIAKIGQTRCAQCKVGYYVNVDGKCSLLPFGCQFANMIDGTCLQCTKGFRFKQLGVCEQQVKIANCEVVNSQDRSKCQICVFGFYPSGNQCKPVSKLCSSHDVTNGNCLGCKDGFILNQNDKKCYDPFCKNQQGDSCLECKNMYQLKQSNNILTCQLNDLNCVTVSNRKCQKCVSGFYINIESTCSQHRQNCLTANPDGFCTQCSPNFQPVNGYCQAISVPTSNIRQENTQSITQVNSAVQINLDPNCMKYENNVCVKCSNNFFKNSQGKCEAVSVYCKGNDERGRCLDCYPGYSLQDGKCIISSPTDVNCKKMSQDNRCQECYQSFFIDRATGNCKRVNVLCKTSNPFGQCTDCYPGYKLSNGTCRVFFQDTNCKRFESDMCVECSDRFYINNGKCSSVNNLCKNYNMRNGQCTVCYQGYGLQSGQCIAGLITGDNDINCRKYENGLCVECYQGFFVNRKDRNKCKQISKLCKSASSNTGDCTDCYPGYSLSSGQCVNDRQLRQKDPNCKRISQMNPNVCQECYSGYIVGQIGVCSVLDPICKKHNLLNGKCTDCYPGYSLTSDGRCNLASISSSNQEAVKDPYCKNFSNGVCIQCSSGYFIPKNTGNLNEMCKQLNPLCKQSDLNNGKCTDCYSGYILADGSCIVAQQIQIPYCQIPAGNGKCQQCMSGYYAKNGVCTPVSILCGDYDKASGKCLNCIPGYVIQRGECIFPALGIDVNCIQYEGAYCNKCSKGFFLSNYICTAIDARCIDFNYNNNQCMLCANRMTASGANCI